MPRHHRPRATHRVNLTGRGTHIGQADPVEAMQAQSIARRYARTDRQARPLYCHVQQKLMYDTREIAKSTGQALERLKAVLFYAYRCPTGNHWHLTTNATGERVSA